MTKGPKHSDDTPSPSATEQPDAVRSESAEPQDTTSDGNGVTAGDLLAAIHALDQRLSEHLAATARCNQTAFDRLYEEMEQYKNNFLLEIQRGLLIDIMLLYDGVHKCLMHYHQTDSIDRNALVGNLEGLLVETEEILARRDILPMTEPHAKLDRTTQKAVKSIHTTDPGEDLTIVDKMRTGFLIGKRVFRREEVVIKKYIPDEGSGSLKISNEDE